MEPDLNFCADKDIHFVLKSHAETRPDAAFLHWAPFSGEDRTYSYKEFYDDVLALAAGLQKRGIARGDFLLLHANNCPEFLLSWHACAALGAVIVTTNPRSSLDELTYFIDHAKPKAIITQPAFLDLVDQTGADVEWIASTETDSGEAAAPAPKGILKFADLYGNAGDLAYSPVDPMAPLSVQYTSGTTSRPKGVVWTHANAVWAGQVGASHKHIRTDDTALVITPLCHTNAMSWAHLPVLWSGGALALQPKFSASRFWDTAVKYGCTWGNVIPFAVQALLTKPVPETHNMNFWIVGAANVGPIDQHFGVQIVGAWGMTETVIHATYTPPQLPSPPLSMGMPMPQYDFKVVDPNGKPTPKGKTGALMIRGKRGISLFLEYLHNPEATNASFDDQGWFDTGDRVTLVDHGHFKFADRTKDMLKVGAENVAASEIEAVVSSLPKVMESAVVAKPDPMKDEVPVAFVRTTEPSDALKDEIFALCNEKLADFKVPVAIVFCEDFPRAEVNKIAKGELRKRAAALDLS